MRNKIPRIVRVLLGLCVAAALHAQTEVPNDRQAVAYASGGDYILLPSGMKYVLTQAEIAILRGAFNFNDLSGVESVAAPEEANLPAGTEIKQIAGGHTAYLFPNGEVLHEIKTTVSFTAFLRHIEETYYPTSFVGVDTDIADWAVLPPVEFTVFRALVRFQVISDGIEDIQSIDVKAYNYNGGCFEWKYCQQPDMVWGNIPEDGAYLPIGETESVDFDVK